MADTFIPLRFSYTGSSVTAVAEYQTGDTLQHPGNFQFVGDGRRISAPMGYAAGSFAGRLFHQSSVANQNSFVSVMPNGTSRTAGFQAWSDPTNLENSARLDLYISGAVALLASGRTGSATYLPLQVSVNGNILHQYNLDSSIECPTAGTRLRGDMASGVGSFTNRLMYQSSGGSQTQISAIPPTGGVISGVQLWGGTDLENSTRFDLVANGGTQTCQVQANPLGTAAAWPITFITGGNERMRVSAIGDVMIGATTSDPINGGVKGAAWQNASGLLQVRSGTAGGSCVNLGAIASGTAGYIGFFYGTNGVGSITSSSTTTSYNTSSDYRLKDNVQPLDPLEAAARIMAYEPCTWTWRVDGSYGKGFIAHKNQAVDPETAHGEKDGVRRLGSIRLPDYTLVAERVDEPADLSEFGDGAEWLFTEEVPIYQGRDDTKMIPDMIAVMQRQEARINQLEEQLQRLVALAPTA